jgi:hypothetical protein
MTVIQAWVEVKADHSVTIRVPDDVSPGEWDAVLVLAHLDVEDERRPSSRRELRAVPPPRPDAPHGDAVR